MRAEGSLLSLFGERLNSRDGVLSRNSVVYDGRAPPRLHGLGRGSPRQSHKLCSFRGRKQHQKQGMFVSLGPELQVVGCLKGEERVRRRTNIQGSQPTTAPMNLTHPRSAWDPPRRQQHQGLDWAAAFLLCFRPDPPISHLNVCPSRRGLLVVSARDRPTYMRIAYA